MSVEFDRSMRTGSTQVEDSADETRKRDSPVAGLDSRAVDARSTRMDPRAAPRPQQPLRLAMIGANRANATRARAGAFTR